jgi:drug/metabolite transporter (DMT)-like permease
MFGSYQSQAAALATAMCWAACSLFFTAGGRRVGSLPVNAIRLTLGLIMLTMFGVVVHGRVIPTNATQHAWLWLSLSGVVGMAICDLCLFEAFLWIGPRVGMLILTLAPPIAALLSWWFLGEAMTPLNIGGMVMVLFGVAWVVLERQSGPDGSVRRHPTAGVLLAIAAAVGQGVGAVLSKYGMKTIDGGVEIDHCEPFAAAQIRDIAGLAAIAVFYVAIRAWPKTIAALRDRRAMAHISAGAFFGPFLGVALSMVALKSGLVGIASTIIMTAPIFVIPLVMIFHKERVSLRAVAGAAAAVAGIGVLTLRENSPAYEWLMNVFAALG